MAIPAHSTGTGAKSGETERRTKRETAGASSPAFAPPRRVLAPLDFSAMSFQALEYAGALALWFKASLCLVHTVETATQLNDLDNVTLMMSEQEITTKALAKLKRLARTWQARGVEVECRVVKGGPFGKYCSEHCKHAGQLSELRCYCQHPECRTASERPTSAAISGSAPSR